MRRHEVGLQDPCDQLKFPHVSFTMGVITGYQPLHQRGWDAYSPDIGGAVRSPLKLADVVGAMPRGGWDDDLPNVCWLACKCIDEDAPVCQFCVDCIVETDIELPVI